MAASIPEYAMTTKAIVEPNVFSKVFGNWLRTVTLSKCFVKLNLNGRDRVGMAFGL